MKTFIDHIATVLSQSTNVSEAQIRSLIEIPPRPELGDFAFPCFVLSKQLKRSPVEVAAQLAKTLQFGSFFKRVEAAGPYLNFFLDDEALAKLMLSEIFQKGEGYGKDDEGQGKTIAIDYSSPNIAKPFGITHLRTTVIGAALVRLYQTLGYKVVGINYIGDWGTPFGMILAAFEEKGDWNQLKKDPIEYCYKLYSDYNQMSKADESLRDKARNWFRRLEAGDEEALNLWRAIRDISLNYFKKIYDLLGLSFDHFIGESFYNDKMEATIKRIEEKGLLKQSEGAWIVDLSQYGMPPCLIKKSDGATLYATRDLCAAEHRAEEFKFDKLLYVVGTPQKLHFQQLFKVLELMGYPWAKNMVHVDFGHIVGMKTREGNLIYLEEVLKEAVAKAKEKIVEGRKLENREVNIDEISEAVGIGAIIFNDLKNRRVRDVVFDWDQMLSFDGETGPYLQYAHVRLCGIIRNSKRGVTDQINFKLLKEPEERSLTFALGRYPQMLNRAAEEYEPSILSDYLLEVASLFHSFYNKHRVINSGEELEAARLLLVNCTRQVLANGLRILGLVLLERM
jgi:arginyl-tRNA synthetase